MIDLAYLVWELQAVRRREKPHRQRAADSPEAIARATQAQLAALAACLLLAFAGDVLGFFEVTAAYPGVRAAYATLLAVESLLLVVEVVAAALAGSSWLLARMGDDAPSLKERRLHGFSVFMSLAFSFLADLPMNVVKFVFLHITRFSSTETKQLLLASAVLCCINTAGKTVLYLLHSVWKQMTPKMDPLHEKSPNYFADSPCASTCLWGIGMMMPVVNLLFSLAVLCMTFSTTALE